MAMESGRIRSKKKISGANAVGNSENDVPWLLGGIVEKGFSDEQQNKLFTPIPVPKPTVLPFPVARHRSHGPHWAPIRSKRGSDYNNYNIDEDEDEDGETGKDLMDFGPISAFANPIRRKEKKGLDLGNWRELLRSDHSFSTSKVAKLEEKGKGGQDVEMMNGRNTISYPTLSDSDVCAPMEIIEEPHFNSHGAVTKTSLETTPSPAISSYSSNNFGNEQVPMSLESQIDTENLARLQGMSADEIAEAQAEIMEKMDPTLLKVLRERGQEKLKKRNRLNLNAPVNDEPSTSQSQNKFIEDVNGSAQSGSDISQAMTTEISKDAQSGQDQGVSQNSDPVSNSLWNEWRERIEAVRWLRFSLDGTVVRNDDIQVPENSAAPDCSRHSADNVTERDFLRTEGDPGAAGYTIKEAVALSRSVIPGQRSLALHLLASVLNKALQNICQNQVGSTMRCARSGYVSCDWEAVWAFALGPEPELILSLRMSLDDNHDSVVLACAKVIHCILSCDLNENFFDISEHLATYEKDSYTAPVFRSKPEIDVGFLHGGFWKYSAKTSNILPFGEDISDDETEGKHTIQDDIVVAGQDFAAGLVRMGILPRICYLLETNPTAALEECLISILVALARHSPTTAYAIMMCPRLVQTVVNRFSTKDSLEVHPSKIKSVSLLKVLARSDKKNCIEFIKNGIFRDMTMHLYQSALSLNQWVKSGRENCKLSSALMVEQLRLWKVCLQYGYCVSYFPELFPSLCLWLNPPTFERLVENNILSEFTLMSREAYLVLEALARKLPKFYSQRSLSNQMPDGAGKDTETWSWNYVSPMVDLAVKWLVLKTNPCISATPVLWVISAVMRMLYVVLERVTPDGSNPSESGRQVPWLPEFVPKIGLEIAMNGFLNFSGAQCAEYGRDTAEGGSLIKELCHMREQNEPETSLASVCCLHGLVRVIVSVDNLIHLARIGMCSPSQRKTISVEGKILEDGILKGSLAEWRSVLDYFMKVLASEWHYVQSIETFGRGGPAPGVGVGWGVSGGGFWSPTVLLIQTDAAFLIQLLEMFPVVSFTDLPAVEDMTFNMQRINSALGVCLTIGPRDKIMMEKALDILFQVPVLKYLDHCIRSTIHSNGRCRLFEWEYKEDNYLCFSEILASHYKKRWLSVKKKQKAINKNLSSGNIKSKKGSTSLDTIHEDLDSSDMTSKDPCDTSLVVEWAHQRLSLPMHWFLSSISTIFNSKQAGLPKPSNILNAMVEPDDFLEVAKSGLFFSLGVEVMSSFLSHDVSSPIQSVPLVWKLHSLSVILLPGLTVLEEDMSRDVYEALQDLYGKLLDEARVKNNSDIILEKKDCLLSETRKECRTDILRFQSEIHESYSAFIETLVEQFAAVSYGNLTYGRQVAIYLHRCCEAPMRLAAWNALSNARVLELLPPLEKCFGEVKGYLEPVEDNEGILEAYVKSWVTGALDRAVTRESVAYTLVLHHLSSFLFLTTDKFSIRNKLVKSLLRDYIRKPQHEKMMLDFIHYNKQFPHEMLEENEDSSLQKINTDRRFNVLTEACEKIPSLLTQVEKLKSLCK